MVIAIILSMILVFIVIDMARKGLVHDKLRNKTA